MANGRRSAVWTNRDETWLYREPDILEKKTTLEIGIASATEFHMVAAYNIPSFAARDQRLDDN
jgi:hypothetical protein